MMDEARSDIEDISFVASRHIDEICDRFEAKWKGGERPRIEEFLEGTGPERSVLLEHLLELELDYRRRGGEDPVLEDYRERFRGHSIVLERFFSGPDGEGDRGIADLWADGTTDELPERAPDIDPDAPLPFSDFELRRKLGETRMSTVFEAVQRSLDKRVAVKVLSDFRTTDPTAVERFLREARAVARLRYPHIVDVHGIGRTDDGGYFLVMDLIDGIDLEKRIEERGVPSKEAAHIVATVADAVQHAHDHGIIHRDLKPSNVLLEGGKRPLLTDFGLAKHLHGDLARFTDSGEILGTLCYMAPEQAEERRWGAVGPRTDVFGLGSILYSLLARGAPFSGGNLNEVLDRVKSPAPPRPPNEMAEGVPPALEAICMRCLSKPPADRYASASDVARALREWLATVETSDLGIAVGSEDAGEEIASRLERASVPEALDIVRGLERRGGASAVRLLLYCLRHESVTVGKRAGKAILRIGWQTAAGAIERMARERLEEDLAVALDGLATFEAHPDTVALLERLVPTLQGKLRNRAVLLLERKRLALISDRIAALFEEIESSYRIEKALGQGPFTACYRARDERFDLPVVVRVLRPEFAAQPEIAASFLDLGKESYAHVHQNLLSVRDVGSAPEQNLYYVVRDYVEGITLEQLLNSEKGFTVEQIIDVLRNVSLGLTPVHSRGRVHGGIKPSNIFVREDGDIVLGDRSLPLDRCNLPLDRLSYDLLYAAPEMGAGDGEVGPASDFYALGCIAYELVCGSPPFTSDRPMELIVRHARDAVPAFSPRVELSERGEAVIRRLLAKEPESRFRGVKEVVCALSALRPEPEDMASLTARLSRRALATESTIQRLVPMSVISMSPPSTSSEMSEKVGEGGMDLLMRSVSGRTPPPSSEEIRRRGYRILRVLGEGGMGVVYEAVQDELDRKVALKVIQHASGEIAKRFRREARLMAKLSHPHIVPVFDLFEDGGSVLVIAMRLMEEGLNEKLRDGSVLRFCEALAIAEDVARGLDYAHSRGVIHRDVKPGNILLDENGRAHLADFGLAGLHAAYEEEEASITQVGQMLGTPAYMAPEQFEESELTGAADVYSLGVTLYEMLSGERPYPGKSMKQVLFQVVQGKTPRLRRRAKVPRTFEKLVERMMFPKAASRPTAGEIVKEIRTLRKKHCAEKQSVAP